MTDQETGETRISRPNHRTLRSVKTAQTTESSILEDIQDGATIEEATNEATAVSFRYLGQYALHQLLTLSPKAHHGKTHIQIEKSLIRPAVMF